MERACKRYEYNPDYAIAPGVTIKEEMEALGLSPRELSFILGITEAELSDLFIGKTIITSELASRIEIVTEVPARFWLNYESQYRQGLSIGLSDATPKQKEE